MRRLLHILPAAAFVLTAAVFTWMLYQGQFMGRDPSILPSALIDKLAPEFTLPPLRAGGPGLSSTDLAGQVSVVNIFASWCVPCKAEHPLLMRLRRARDSHFQYQPRIKHGRTVAFVAKLHLIGLSVDRATRWT